MRKICAITGSRADSSPLWPVGKIINEYSMIAFMHLETEGLYGHEEYLRESLTRHRPDIVLLLGDRYETLVAAQVAAHLSIPIAHLAGGDVTEGAVDDSYRHAITKLSYWHFPECQLHADRIIQMGEAAERVFPLGAPGVDLLAEPCLTRPQIEMQLGIKLRPPVTLVCFHPETLSEQNIDLQIDGFMRKVRGETIIISGANQDPGGAEINARLEAWADMHHRTSNFSAAYPRRMWTSLMYEADLLLGNSSGFITEGMTIKARRDAMGLAPLEIEIVGERQKGRYEEALAMFARERYPFGIPGEVARKIVDKLIEVKIPTTPRKEFHGITSTRSHRH